MVHDGISCQIKNVSDFMVEFSIQGRYMMNPCPWRLVEFEGKVAIVDYPWSHRYYQDIVHVVEFWVMEDFQNQVWSLELSGLPSPLKTDHPAGSDHKLLGATSAGDETIHACRSTPLIDGDGVLNEIGVGKFMEDQDDLEACGLSYSVVSILGPQSSGKSTILNHMFGTNFQEMNAIYGRSQTTKGIWMAKAMNAELATLVIDVEGTDGCERADQGETTFEKQSALFALAVSDIMLINMWIQDIGRENAANKPLLRIVFQVMMRLFTDRKRTLMFVIRDDDRETPEEMLEIRLRAEVQKIWDKLPKPEKHKETPLSQLFNVEIAILPHYKHERDRFLHEVAKLRERIGGLVKDRTDAVPASAFCSSATMIWEMIKENKDLDLPNINVLIAKEHCERIMLENLSNFAENEEWLRIKEAVELERIPDFSEKLSAVLAECFQGYDEEAIYYDQGVRSAKRLQLEEGLLHLIQPVFNFVLGHIRSETLAEFKKAFHVSLTPGQKFSSIASEITELCMNKFEQTCQAHAIKQLKWDISKVREGLQQKFKAFIVQVHADQLAKITKESQENLTRDRELSKRVKKLLDKANEETWPGIRNLHQQRTQSEADKLKSLLSCFDVDEQEKDKMCSNLQGYTRGVIEKEVRGAAKSIVLRMKDRFSRLFYYASDSSIRSWKDEDIQAISRSARTEALKVLSLVAAICLDDNKCVEVVIWNSLSAALHPNVTEISLDSNSWEGIPPETTVVLKPTMCRHLWYQFVKQTNHDVNRVQASQEGLLRYDKEVLERENALRDHYANVGRPRQPTFWETLLFTPLAPIGAIGVAAQHMAQHMANGGRNVDAAPAAPPPPPPAPPSPPPPPPPRTEFPDSDSDSD